MDEHGIKTMKLYHQVERVFNELTALGIGQSDPVDVELLSQFDQYHYFGTAAVDEGVRRLNISQAMEVLEVGGGIGGPSRHIAHCTGCRITALELQPDLNKTAEALTARCGLSAQVSHVCGDILAGAPKEGYYDALVSWLTFLHIADRPNLYRHCFEAIKPGAGIYAEDFFDRNQLTESEKQVLSVDVASDYTPHFDTYFDDLDRAGFVDIKLTDMTESWMDYSRQRVAAYRDNWSRNVELHGRELVEGLDHFYSSVDNLFNGGNFGGIRIEARKSAR